MRKLDGRKFRGVSGLGINGDNGGESHGLVGSGQYRSTGRRNKGLDGGLYRSTGRTKVLVLLL